MPQRVTAISTLTLIITLACGLWVQAGTNLELTLEEAIQLAVTNQLNLGAAQAGVTEAEARVAKAKASRWLTGNLSSSYTRLQEAPPNIGISTDPSESTFPFSVKPGSNNIYSSSIRLQWPLYTGGKIRSGIELAQYGVDAATVEYEKQYDQTIYQAIQGYVNLLRADGFVQLSQQFVETIEEHLKVITTNYQLGYVTRTDLLETEIRKSQAEQGLLKATHGRRLAEESLKNLLGLSATEELLLAELPAISSDLRLPTLEEAVALALQSRPELVGLEITKGMAAKNLVLAQAYLQPTVALVGSYGTQQATTLADSFAEGDWMVTVSAQWNFFDSGTGRAGVREAQAGLEKIEHSWQQARNGIELEVKQKHLTVTESRLARELAGLSLEKARENYEFIKAKYDLGAATNLELLTAQNTLNQTLNEELNAEYDYYLAVVDLYKALGQVDQFLVGVDENA